MSKKIYKVYENPDKQRIGNPTNIIYWIYNIDRNIWYNILGDLTVVHCDYEPYEEGLINYWKIHELYSLTELISEFPGFINI